MQKKIFLLLVSIALISSCSGHKTKKREETKVAAKETQVLTPPSEEAKHLATDQEASFVTEFSFKKGSEQLDSVSKKKLEDISKKALSKGKIEMIKVITWADQEYPSAIKNKLSDAQQALAKKRNDRIKSYLKKLNRDKSTDIELISMAQRPGFLKNLLSSDDARIKRSLETAGIPDTESTNIKSSKASKSIVLLLVKNEKK